MSITESSWREEYPTDDEMNKFNEILDCEEESNKGFDLKQYNLIFHYNHYKGKWSCFHRDKYRKYFIGDTRKVGLGDSTEEAYINYKNILTNE